MYSINLLIERNFAVSVLIDHYSLARLRTTSIALLRSQARCQKKGALMKFYNSVYLPTRRPMSSDVCVAIDSISRSTVYRSCQYISYVFGGPYVLIRYHIGIIQEANQEVWSCSMTPTSNGFSVVSKVNILRVDPFLRTDTFSFITDLSFLATVPYRRPNSRISLSSRRVIA